MSLSNFERLIECGGLWFAAADSFEDALEGTKSVRESQSREAMWDEVGVPEKHRETIRHLTHWHRKSSFVNCWMMNTNESEWMWHRYAEKEGVAIESTYANLRAALPSWIWIYQVEYINYDTDSMVVSHSLAPFFYKRKEYADERELRAVIENFPASDTRRRVAIPNGHPIKVDLGRVINRVILSPSPTAHLLSRVETLVRPLGLTISRSSLDRAPML
jgi:hypothetical protein